MLLGTSVLDYKVSIKNKLADLIETTSALKKLPVLGPVTRTSQDLKTRKSDLTLELSTILTNLVKSVSIDPSLDINSRAIEEYIRRGEQIVTAQNNPNLVDLKKILNNLSLDFKTHDSNNNILKEGLVHFLAENFLEIHITLADKEKEASKQLISSEKTLKAKAKELNKLTEYFTLERSSKEQLQFEFDSFKQICENERSNTKEQIDLYEKEVLRL